MIEWLKKNKWGVIGGTFVLFILIPIIINLLFVIGDTYPLLRVKWDAGDVLGFYGSILAAGGTIAGVFLSILYSQKSYRDDMHNRVLPYFSLQYYRGAIDPVHPSKTADLALVIDAEDIQFKLRQVLPKDFHLFAIKLDNIGNGPAVNLSLRCFKTDAGADSRFTAPKTIVVKEAFCINIMYDTAAAGSYIIRLHYKDIYGRSYYQDCRLDVSEKGHKVDISGVQGKENEKGGSIL